MSVNEREGGSAAPPERSRPGLFREDALRHHLGRRDFGDVLRLPPFWTRLAFPLILLLVGATLLYLCVGTIDQYARGSGVVRLEEGDAERFVLVALFPGETLPRLRTGMRLRVELSGHPGVSVWTTAEVIGDRILGPAEARRALGPSAEDSVKIEAPVVVVRAPLDGRTRAAGDGDPILRDGTVAKVETSVSTERLIFALLPGLESVFGG